MDVYKGDDKIGTSGITLLSDLDLQETYRAIDSVATGRIPSLSCDQYVKKWKPLPSTLPFDWLK